MQAWAASAPAWLEVKTALSVDTTLPLDEGERAAIALARELAADRLLIDDRDGREVAVRLGIPVAGTLAVLHDAAMSGLLDLKTAFDQLKQTTFRASPGLFGEVLADFEKAKVLQSSSELQPWAEPGEGT